MTIKNLEKAIDNRTKRKHTLTEYEKVSKAINEFNNEDFFFTGIKIGFSKLDETRGVFICPNSTEFYEMLIKMRDRYDKEIEELDREFNEL